MDDQPMTKESFIENISTAQAAIDQAWSKIRAQFEEDYTGQNAAVVPAQLLMLAYDNLRAQQAALGAFIHAEETKGK